jgi:regulator of cell morphogenesis and NO signaling
MIAVNETIRSLAATRPGAASVFEKYGIDYCCGGARPLDEACRENGRSAATVVAEIDRRAEDQEARDWSAATSRDLIDHILATHHAYLREELPRLDARLRKVADVHGDRHGDSLYPLVEVYAGLRAELGAHMLKEERILSTAIADLDAPVAPEGRSAPPFGSVANPIRMMEHEHESAGRALARMRTLTRDYTPPADACTTYRALLDGLAYLERDLHQHIHLENNILFPRAQRLARATGNEE